MRKLFTVICLALSFSAFAHEDDHPMSTITGKNINLSIQGHTFAGQVHDKIIFSRVYGLGHSINDTMIDDGKKAISTSFEKTKEYFGGVILDGGNSTTIQFVKAVDYGDKKSIIISVGFDKQYEVEINADGFDGKHFTNPSYKVVIDGEEISFKLNDGKACLMMSIQMIFSIVGSYIH